MTGQKLLAFCIGIAGLALIQLPAFAQKTDKLRCQNVGYNPSQPIGDSKGHAISASEYTCVVEGGPANGAVVTGTTIWEWRKANAKMLSGIGVGRKPGTIYSYENTSGKAALIMSDGKVVGVEGSGRGRFTMMSGPIAKEYGKAYSWTFKTTGAGIFEIEVVHE